VVIQEIRAAHYCCCLVVVDSCVTVFWADTSGLEASGLISTLRELLVDSVVVLGAGAAAGAAVAAGAAAATGGACWQPVSVRPTAVKANAARNS
jgi:hypothetical protein